MFINFIDEVIEIFYRIFAPKKAKNPSKHDMIIKETKGLFNALAVALIIRTFLYQPFIIPSESMYPTLLVGDFLFVSKFSYGYCNRTFPLASYIMDDKPWEIKNRVMQKDLMRGDVVVFYNPKHTNAERQVEPVDYIKRLIGLPGDRVQVKGGVIYINEVPVKLEQIEDYEMTDSKGGYQSISQYKETLPNGVVHTILKSRPMGRGNLDNTEEFLVPEGHYFLMGDNRDNSQDSRVGWAVGFVPSKNIIGRADVVFLSTKAELLKPWTYLNLRYNRWPHVIR